MSDLEKALNAVRLAENDAWLKLQLEWAERGRAHSLRFLDGVVAKAKLLGKESEDTPCSPA